MQGRKKKKFPMIATSLRLRPQTMEIIEQLANDKQREKSEIMRIIIENYINTNNDLRNYS